MQDFGCQAEELELGAIGSREPQKACEQENDDE